MKMFNPRHNPGKSVSYGRHDHAENRDDNEEWFHDLFECCVLLWEATVILTSRDLVESLIKLNVRSLQKWFLRQAKDPSIKIHCVITPNIGVAIDECWLDLKKPVARPIGWLTFSAVPFKDHVAN